MQEPKLALAAELDLVGPRGGPGVCGSCFNLTDGYDRCFACMRSEAWVDRMLPVSYSLSGRPLHRALAGYKRMTGGPAQRLRLQLSLALDIFAAHHTGCLARSCGGESFAVVTSVPSGDPRRHRHPLELVLGRLSLRLRERYEPLLRRTEVTVPARKFDGRKYEALRRLDGTRVLLLDDTWTSGASAQSAAAALKAAGAATVGCLVFGRHLKATWHGNERRLDALQPRFSWRFCALCVGAARGEAVNLPQSAERGWSAWPAPLRFLDNGIQQSLDDRPLGRSPERVGDRQTGSRDDRVDDVGDAGVDRRQLHHAGMFLHGKS
jgi:predicted amidophosphoribosyltransferase